MFDWDDHTWSPDGSLHHTYTDVDGSTVDVDINVTGDVQRFPSNYPRRKGVNTADPRLGSFPNFIDKTESVHFTYTFSQPVIIQNLTVYDIEGNGSYADAVYVTGLNESAQVIDPDNVSFGSNIVQINGHQFESNNNGGTPTTDDRGKLTFSFSNEPITQFTITHYAGAIAADNPGGGYIAFSNFNFFYVYDYADAAGYGLARHIRYFTEPWLGESRGDADLSAPQTNANADADDTDGHDDEDGVTFRSPHGGDHAEIYADTQVVNNTGADVYVCAWLDRWDGSGNGDGSFDAGDSANSPAQTCQTVADNGGTATTTTFYWNGLPEVSGHTFARFRVCATLADCNSPTGDANGGEVEDYRIDFNFDPTLAIIDNFRVETMTGPAVAELTGLDTSSESPVAVVRWETQQEHGTVGFYVERQSVGESRWHRVNSSGMLPGLITSPQGGEYLLLDPLARPGTTQRYRLIEEEIWGTQKTYGPWQVSIAKSPQAMLRADTVSKRLSTSAPKTPWRGLGRSFAGKPHLVTVEKYPSSPQPAQSLPAYTLQGSPTQGFSLPRKRVSRLLFRTREQGMYRIAFDDLATVTGIATQRIIDKLLSGRWSFSSGGSSAAYYLDFDRQEFVFTTDLWQTTETGENIYCLGKFRKRQGWNMAIVNGQGPEQGQPDQFQEILAFTEDNLLLTWVHQDENADYGYWDYIMAPNKPAITLTVNLPDPAAASPTPGMIRVVLRGAGDKAAGDDHLVRIALNGEQLAGEVRWDGNNQAILETTFDQRLLGGTESGETVAANVTIEGEALNGAAYSLVYIESIIVQYDRKMYAHDNELRLHDTTPGIQTVSGFSSADIRVMEHPHGADARFRKDVTVTESANGYQVSFVSSGGEYQLSSAPHDIQAEPDLPSRLLSRKNRAEYLVIAPDSLQQSAQALADYRGTTFATTLVRLQDIYDIFSHGRTDSAAIEQFLSYISQRWQQVPEFITLMGRGTLDHADRLGSGESQLPLRMAACPWGLIGSDNRYADINGDHVPEYAIGRIAVSTDAQGMIYVNKLQAYEAEPGGGWRKFAAVMADDPDSKAGDFHANGNETAADLRQYGFTVEKLYHPDLDLHDTLMTGWNLGRYGLVNYNGHGGRTQLGTSSENFLKATDAALLHNGSHLPIFTALTCAAGDSSYPGILSLGDSLSLQEGGGAIASFVPSGVSLDAPAHQLNLAWIKALVKDDMTVGQAAVQALQEIERTDIQDYMLDLYGVAGDPAVLITP